MHWILEQNLFKEAEWAQLIPTMERFSLPYSVHKVIPFIGELLPPLEPIKGKIICLGQYSMRHTARANNWTPGVYDLIEQTFVVQREHWGDQLLNADSEVCAFRDVKITRPTFIRPIEDSKHFNGTVFDPVYFHEWQDRVCDPKNEYGITLTPNTLVQVTIPKEIYEEYRYWIIDGKIVTRSLYKRGSRVYYSTENIPPQLDIYVRGRLDNWCPHKAFVIDVCTTPNGYKIVEINTINASGFYAGSVQDIVMQLELMEEK